MKIIIAHSPQAGKLLQPVVIHFSNHPVHPGSSRRSSRRAHAVRSIDGSHVVFLVRHREGAAVLAEPGESRQCSKPSFTSVQGRGSGGRANPRLAARLSDSAFRRPDR
jgi:hypothetical protein